MRTLEQLGRLSHLGDFLTFFGIQHDASVLERHASEILARFAREVAAIDESRPVPPEPERLERYGDALRRAYVLFARLPADARRRFRVIDGGLGGDLPRRHAS